MCLTVLAVGVIQICGCGKDNTISLSLLSSHSLYITFSLTQQSDTIDSLTTKKNSVDPHPFKEI